MSEEQWQEAQAGNAISLQKGEVNKEYIGYYLSQKTVETQMGESILWKFQAKDGEKFEVWGFAALDAKLENVTVGTLCKIIFLGKSPKKNKWGKYPYMAKVLINPTAKLETVPEDDEVGF